ncbi:hypothetical protein KWH19_14460 [Xanthomonas campestris pv. pennamericanum]|uniref:hypothetical protein n=1 Tax=Xanthomonas euvesicatoria TaxID=456327 RepID=UPI001C4592C0|nr:hypothetical protein [Xanthomonas euvesicatoria]MBV6810957.1 hypothetical protein [Xanthomonas campestris pv. pennamericanum]
MVGWLQRSSVQGTAVRLPSLHESEEAALPGESGFFCGGAPVASLLTDSGGCSAFDVIGCRRDVQDGNGRSIR